MQHGIRNKYRACVWNDGGSWWTSIETPNDVGGWYRVGLAVGGRWWQETYDITALKSSSESEAQAKAEQLLAEIRASHAGAQAPHLAAEAAQIIS